MSCSSTVVTPPKVPVIQYRTNQSNTSRRQQLENQAFSLLQACTSFKQVVQIHAHINRNSIHQNNFVATKLVSRCFSFHNPSYATRVFAQVPDPNHYLWNTMIKGFVHAESYEDALKFYLKMVNHGSKSNSFTYPFVLKACAELTAFEEGEVVHGQLLKLGFSSDVYVQTSLIDIYGSCHHIVAARQVFDRIPERDIVAWNVILASYVRCDLVGIAKELFEYIPGKNVSSWTTMIGGYVQVGDYRKALEMFRRMQIEGVRPDKMTIVTVLSAIADLGSLDLGKWVHDYVKSNDIEIDDFMGTSLINMYSKCGSIDDAREVFVGIRLKTITCYNAMITGFAVHGLGEEAIKVFKEAERTGSGIDDITMIGVLTACSHSGLVELGRMYFHSMREHYGIEPRMEHYGCMVDLLGRAGQFDEAMEIIDSIEADQVMLYALAFACRIHGHVELGEELARRMTMLDPTNSGLLVLKSNLYAVNGRWEEAAGVRRLMENNGIQKKPGCSWIEVDDVVHEFVAADDSHPCSEEIISKVAELSEQMKLFSPRELLVEDMRSTM
ncbi:putative pentatricopeptide repeat-containing protein At5g59200, chloroplastic [Telopea speciosissima]|uniref:putative pentatricopeptide repeat-containing protein At5g59200, chloroplastic n=1 Tax=Telopea speciosissima TaxID=54955 RepID=UPI001CC510A3|nr:putative pentatricopeptide repeat-containing protein At5g59200, chloroplastic [Telopea speciosissima]